jgi:PhzF family phenazine biosynthesis protein
MKIPAYHIDAFSETVFCGNPAMVCRLERWLGDETLQRIARENNLPVTAFFVSYDDHYHLRWFTPTAELNLCGHGTIAAAAVIFDFTNASRPLTFQTKSGTFTAEKDGRLICLEFPVEEAVPCAPPEKLVRALGRQPEEILHAGNNYLAVYKCEADIRAIEPGMALLEEIDGIGTIVTSRGNENVDYVSRYFAPKIGIPEDAATGSIHCALAPYWSKRLGKSELRAVQLSQRRGELVCEYLGNRIKIAATAVRYAEGFVYL